MLTFFFAIVTLSLGIKPRKSERRKKTRLAQVGSAFRFRLQKYKKKKAWHGRCTGSTVVVVAVVICHGVLQVGWREGREQMERFEVAKCATFVHAA